jgi:hypothetical protein
MRNNFDRWIAELRDDVIKGEYGHKDTEYTVCPDVWRALYDQGLTPSQAFRSALRGHSNDAHSGGAGEVVEAKELSEGYLVTIQAGETLH